MTTLYDFTTKEGGVLAGKQIPKTGDIARFSKDNIQQFKSDGSCYPVDSEMADEVNKALALFEPLNKMIVGAK